MPRFYCDYCDVYLTHDSFSGRKQHMRGRRHQDNVRQYYMQFLKKEVIQGQQAVIIPGNVLLLLFCFLSLIAIICVQSVLKKNIFY